MKRKGFTLVELLIVIAILGALASLMTLSGTNATASANATKIINNLQTMKTAALLFYNDYIYSGDSGFTTDSFTAKSADYFDQGTLKDLRSSYAIFIKKGEATTPSEWYAIYKFEGTSAEDIKIKELLEVRAEKFGLLTANDLTTAPENKTFVASTSTTNKKVTTTTYTAAVAIRVR